MKIVRSVVKMSR